MKRKIFCLLLPLCLLLSGCAVLDGREVSVTPHVQQSQSQRTDTVNAENYLDLMEALANMIASGIGEDVITVSDYASGAVESGMNLAIRYAMEDYPIGAYAVEDITYEMGISGGEPALAVTITYSHSQAQIQRIRSMENIAAVEAAIVSAMEGYDSSVVLLVDNYIETDILQMVENYAQEHPERIMEQPALTVDVYGTGLNRVIEVGFFYQNSREDLRQMQEQVTPVFDAAELYVSGDGPARQKYSQLYGFLMERFYYTIETSITPAYSLLRHGVGDSRAFATVYAAMCRRAGLECFVITGTHDGEPRTWNMIQVGARYFHLDLLRCRELGRFREFTDEDMGDYVWDYSAYPESISVTWEEDEDDWTNVMPEPPQEPIPPGEPEETQPTEPEEPPRPTQPTEPEETTQPTEPEETTEPAQPTEPEEPTGPAQPTQPEQTPPDIQPEESTAPEETEEKIQIF